MSRSMSSRAKDRSTSPCVAGRALISFAGMATIFAAGLTGCSGKGSGSESSVVAVSFAPVTTNDVLTQIEIDDIIERAEMSVDAPNIAIAIVDRTGNILRVWNRNPASQVGDVDNKIAVSIARTAAFLSHSQAPLTSRTGQFISTFHFPVVFDTNNFAAPIDPTSTSPTQPTLGVANTGQGPLWQIDASDRGAVYGPFDAGQSLPQLTNPDGSTPSPGFTALPGGVPLYKRMEIVPAGTVARRLVGGIGAYVTTGPTGTGNPLPEVAEYVAFNGSLMPHPTPGGGPPPFEDYSFGPIPPEGAVYLVGILLPYLQQVSAPPGFGPGAVDGITVFTSGAPGAPDPINDLITPRDSPSGATFTANEVRTLVDQTAAAAREVHAAIRLPASSPCSMVIGVTDTNGEILALLRMDDATLFSVDIAITKARNAYYYCNPLSLDFDGARAGQHPLAGIVPPGTAITSRTLGFLSQPRFPPGIDSSSLEGPLYPLALENRKPSRFDQMGFAPTAANQSGIIFFPGSAALYRNGVLIGGIGVSGDGVEQDDLVTTLGIQRAEAILGFQMEPPANIRCDNYSYQGVHLPYAKFPQNPGG